MEHNMPKFRLRLNLFDGIVLVLALAVGVLVLWTALRPAASTGEAAASSSSTVRYTIRFQKWIDGTSNLIQPGDKLVDNIKNYALGSVISAESAPAQALLLNQEQREFTLTEIAGYEDVLVTVESPCTITNEAITLDGGYALRVGSTTYIRGEGYMASGPVISIEREG